MIIRYLPTDIISFKQGPGSALALYIGLRYVKTKTLLAALDYHKVLLMTSLKYGTGVIVDKS